MNGGQAFWTVAMNSEEGSATFENTLGFQLIYEIFLAPVHCKHFGGIKERDRLLGLLTFDVGQHWHDGCRGHTS